VANQSDARGKKVQLLVGWQNATMIRLKESHRPQKTVLHIFISVLSRPTKGDRVRSNESLDSTSISWVHFDQSGDWQRNFESP
jgi:hypothetical protein